MSGTRPRERPYATKAQRFCGGTGNSLRGRRDPPVDSPPSPKLSCSPVRDSGGRGYTGKEPSEMAATNINRVVLTGNLTRDPELRSLQSGMSVCSLRIASNTRPQGNTTGEGADKPNYFSVTVWGAQGENCARFLSKGRPVALDGRLEWREWQGQD